ncbi:protein MTSS 2-like [Tigriopus californicus]|uniref:protein MTSS 2-like n=1 Tax=Tigriopus californicus TaxID=6832 RepID=UPI0027DA2B01|nr:protein MTSS 2-like [Tigriopus californicus]
MESGNSIGVGGGGLDSGLASLSIVIDNDLDKECSALGGLFQQIINEMKVGIPNFEDFVTKASKLHTTLKTTIVVLGSFLDSFQKIADTATNTKGSTRDIGTCLTRIVIRHRALESRMKSLNG